MAQPLVSSSDRNLPAAQRYASIAVHVDEAKLARLEQMVRGIPQALARIAPPALNKTADEMRTWLGGELVRRMAILRKKSIRDRLATDPKASAASWQSGIRISLARFTIASFQTQQTAAGVAWYPGILGTWRSIPRAFLRATYRHYQTGEQMDVAQVYRRTRSTEKGFRADLATRRGDMVRRYPIRVLRGPSLAMVFTKDRNLLDGANKRGGEVLEKKFASQVDRFISAEVPR